MSVVHRCHTAKLAHRVPLCSLALEIVKGLKTDLEKLREENRRLAEQVEVERRRRELERSTADSRIRGLKIQKGKVEARLRRTETRVRAGVCPHCNRTFQQLARHMQAKHPDVAACSHATQED